MQKKCDLVMKGGITSGIVYPHAVCELAEEFEFANIGGTSAGAIAAALTAAAEVRRKTTGTKAGFERLANVPDWLGAPETNGKRSNMTRLFGPWDATKPFFEMGARYLETKSVFAPLRVLLASFNSYGGAALGVLALAVLVALAATRIDGPLAIAAFIGALVIAAIAVIGFVVASVVEAIVALLRILPEHNFALSSGYAISEWLMEEIDATAGVTDGPLTYRHLRDAEVNLEMMTTNLTIGQPYRLPWATRRFSFHVDEWSKLFPPRIMTWMVDHFLPVEQDEKLRILPLPDDMPVVVATRMSMSFPGLLAAVPLYAIDYARRDRARVPEKCWFSDGGIGSNFPVHFFDAPLPRWPTFAINLGVWSDRYHREGQTVYAAKSNKGGLQAWWRPMESVVAFAWSVIDTMQNWRDNSLLRMPGYRDRIAHVLLNPDEGGFNLSMDHDMILEIAGRGKEAAVALRQRFGDVLQPPADVTLSWANHRWVRFRAFMAAMEGAFARYQGAFVEEIFDVPPSYKSKHPDLGAMREKTLQFVKHIRENFGDEMFRKPPVPRPVSVLRSMPEE